MQSKKFGILSVVIGFCSIYIPFFNLITAILAIVFGVKAKKTEGVNLGIIGIVLGTMSLIINLMSFVLSMSLLIFSIVGNLICVLVPMLI